MAKKLLLAFSIFLTILHTALGQDCSSAKEIVIGDNGFAIGHHVSELVDLTDASKEFGEFFPEGFDYLALDHKTVWYKFKIETARGVRVELRQRDSAISQNAVGMSIYSGWSCLPNESRLEPRLIPINKFGEVSTNCLVKGEYLVQVCASHKANDTIWLEITTEKPPLLYDFQETAYDFGMFNGQKFINILTECLSLENSDELHKDLPIDYTKTAWLTFETQSDLQQLSFEFALFDFLNQGEVFVSIFEGDIKNGFESLNLYKDTIRLFREGNITINSRHFLCDFEDNTKYSILIYFKNSSIALARFRLNLLHAVGDNSTYPPTLSQVFNLGKIQPNNNTYKLGIFTCSSKLNEHLCDSVNSDTVFIPRTMYNYQYFPDSIIEYIEYKKFDLASWRVFELTDSGRLSINMNLTYCESNYASGLGGLRIFKGDVRSNCKLPIEASSHNGVYSACVGPGIYSVQFLGVSSREILYNDHCYNSDLGEKFRYRVVFNPIATQPNSKYCNPNSPENLGNISNVLNSGQSVDVTKDYFNLNEINDTLKFGNCQNRIYREFYINNPIILRLDVVNHQGQRNGNHVLYKGRFSDGQNLDSISIVNRRVIGNNTWGNACNLLDAGWFTIVSCTSVDCNNSDLVHYSDYKLRQINACTNPKNKIPSKALSLNPNGNDFLQKSPTPYNWTVPDYAKLYQVGDNCVDCEGDSVFSKKLNELCKPVSSFNPVPHYYYFKLDKKSDIYILQNGQLLYKGDLRFDSLKMLDTDNLIQICEINQSPSGPSYYCGLEPGIYTLVLFTNHNSGLFASVWFDEHLVPKYDHAETAYDFGKIVQNQAFVSSPLDVVSCMTGSHIEHGPNRQGNYVTQPQTIPSYPLDSLKIQQNRQTKRNLWYTFTAEGTGDIEVNLKQFTRPNASLAINLYESSSDPNIPYFNLKDSGQLDSNESLGLKFLVGSTFNIKYNKGNCEFKRYIVHVVVNIDTRYQTVTDNNPIVKKWAIVDVKMTGSDVTPLGDYCSNASEFIVNTVGINQSQPIVVNCHTTGEGYGEDGSNLACLDPGVPFKTTWVKIRVTGQGKNDLTFSVVPSLGSSQNNNQIRFRVLYGDCNALTPGPCLAYFGSSFRLDCMPPGDYFLQVSTPAEVGGSFRVRVGVTPAIYPECKPAPLFEPFANFSFVPPCNDTVVTFNNWSTAGDDIVYHWDFGNGKTSNEKNPTVSFIPDNLIDTFTIKLIVTNTQHNSQDSISKTLRVLKEPLEFSIVTLKDSFCSGFVELSLESNYSLVSGFKWSPAPYFADESQFVYRFATNANQDLFIKVHSNFQECLAVDSIVFNKYEVYSFNLDTFACKGEEIQFDITEKVNKHGVTAVGWFDQSTEYIKTIADTGVFWLQIRKEECVWSDTFKISTPYISDNITPKYNFACNGSSVELGINTELINPIWSNGEQTHNISVNKSGLYSVTANYFHCELSDSFEVELPDFSNVIPPNDTAKCNDELLNLFLNAHQYEVKWFDGSTLPSVGVLDSGSYWVKISDRTCDTVFWFSVDEYPSTLELEPDTTLCDLVPIRLDAGMGQSFIWRPTNEIEQAIQVPDFGIYSVTKVNQFGCVEFDTFVLRRYCGPKLFVPNAFSPNGDGLNDEFLPFNENLISFNMQIYNRWGEMLYNSSNSNRGWNGLFQGKYCQQGVYMYVISYTIEEEGKMIKGVTKGTLNLLR